LTEQLSLGLHLAVMCTEDLPLAPLTAAGRTSAMKQEYVRACEGWPRVRVPAGFDESPSLNVPALIVSGEWDPVTSPRLARVVAGQFSRSQVVVVPRSGHLFAGLDRCLGSMSAEFLSRGKADASCALSVTLPGYVIGSPPPSTHGRAGAAAARRWGRLRDEAVRRQQ